jgi:hypothetical protein
MVGMVIDYAGDKHGPDVDWLQKRLQAIGVVISSGLPEATLDLLYSGIDTLGWLAAPLETKEATRTTFEAWSNKFLVSKLKSIDGSAITATDLYSARCGILHTSRSTSKLSGKGEAREICYQFGENVGLNFFGSTALDSAVLNLEQFALAFKDGAVAFLQERSTDPELAIRVNSRANTFFRWGRLVGTDALVEMPPRPSSTQPL